LPAGGLAFATVAAVPDGAAAVVATCVLPLAEQGQKINLHWYMQASD